MKRKKYNQRSKWAFFCIAFAKLELEKKIHINIDQIPNKVHADMHSMISYFIRKSINGSSSSNAVLFIGYIA